jgi:preprotein translocase subunit YajC
MSHHFTAASLGFHDLVLAATAKKASTSSASSLIFFVLILGVGYFLLIRGPRQRAKRQQVQQQEIGVGDDVLLNSGIVGRVMGFHGDRADVEIAPGIEIEVIRGSIGRRLTDNDGVPEDYEPTEPDPGADDRDEDGEEDWSHTSNELPHGEYDEDEEHDGEHDGEHDEAEDAHETHSAEPDEHDGDHPGPHPQAGPAAHGSALWPAAAVHPDADHDGVPGGSVGEPRDEPGSSAAGETGKA